MRLLGATDEEIDVARGGKVDPDDDDQAFGVFAENWKDLMFFCSLQTRWKVVAMPSGRLRRVGFDWLEVESKVRRCVPAKERTAMLDLLEVLEVEAVKVFNEQG